MTKYRFTQDAYFMGKYYKAGNVVELTYKQAKYNVMSGVLEVVVARPKVLAPKVEPKQEDTKKVTSVETSKSPRKKERSSSKSVGGSYGGSFS